MIKTLFENSGKENTLKNLADSLSAKPDVQCLLILGCDANEWTPRKIDPILKSLTIPVFGGVFPKIIYKQKAYDQGFLVIGLPVRPEIIIVHDLSDPEADHNRALEVPSMSWLEKKPAQSDTVIVFVDGLSKRIESLVKALFLAFGLELNFIGGGAGSLSFKQKPCLITPDGLVMDAGLIVRLPMPSGVGVAHGWQPISTSMKVTESEGNTIYSLDWQPAFERYRELVEIHFGKPLTASNFFDTAKCYPFGINRLGGELLVRDPVTTDGLNGLVCVGEVPSGSFVHLLNGTPETLIAAAAHARYLALDSAPDGVTVKSSTFFIDCISRALFLENRIGEELKAVAGAGEQFGAMTLGEIANNGRDYLEFFNKTSVVVLLGNILE